MEDEGWIRCQGQGLRDEGLGLSVKGGGWRVEDGEWIRCEGQGLSVEGLREEG